MSSKPLEKINGALSLVKDLAAVKSEFDHLELRKRLVEVEAELLDAKEASMDLQEENLSLRSQIELKSKIVDEANVSCIYLIKNGVKVPHCRLCFEDSGKLHQLPDADKRESRCYKCGNYFVINPNLQHLSAVIDTSRNRSFMDMQF